MLWTRATNLSKRQTANYNHFRNVKKKEIMKKYRKKPLVIEAIQFTDETLEECAEWLGDKLIISISVGDRGYLKTAFGRRTYQIKTLEGNHDLNFGDYIIKGIKGEFYPCREDIFNLTYEEVKDEIV
jgi:hypothetical protein